MSAEETEAGDDRFPELLAAYDEALAAGKPAPVPSEAPPELRRRAERGAACLSLLTFLLCAVGAARKNVFLAAGLVVLAIAFRRGALRPLGDSLPPRQ